MRVIADLHIHSRFSRATSKKLSVPLLDRWARIKGVRLLGTGDASHPRWLRELGEQLEEGEGGFYRLKPALRRDFDRDTALLEALPRPAQTELGFVLSTEISTIYKRGEAVRKVHHLVILPDFKAAAAFQTRLERVGNIASDGRPILGIDSRDLLAILRDTDERALLIPAHVWTPWFSALGAKSGFDSLEECYGPDAVLIPALETGLSSNPPMNWAVPSLDPYGIISNSDAHSPEKIGREATVFSMEWNYDSFREALWSVRSSFGRGDTVRAESGPGLLETIEFFPEEGKYHYAGHRKCGVCRSPGETARAGNRCPVCGRPLTEGVMGRVLALAERPVDETAAAPPGTRFANRRPYRSLIPLRELVAELLAAAPASKRAGYAYGELIEQAGSELYLLMDMPLADIRLLRGAGLSGGVLSAAIGRMRAGEISVTPGYDGEYGVIRVSTAAPDEPGLFEEGDPSAPGGEGVPRAARRRAAGKRAGTGKGPPAAGVLPDAALPVAADGTGKSLPGFSFDRDQEAAMRYGGTRAAIIAGPGTGKTAVLTGRIRRLLEAGRDPASILALTFTVRAAAELKERIARPPAAGNGAGGLGGITAATFHAFACSLLREYPAVIPAGFQILSTAAREGMLEAIAGPRGGKPGARRLGRYIEGRKRFLLLPGETRPFPPGSPEAALLSGMTPARLVSPGQVEAEAEAEEAYHVYQQRLAAANYADYDDLPRLAVRLLLAEGEILAGLRRRYRHILVDEYQDVNFAQYVLIRLLAPLAGEDGDAAAELWVIGDPNQAIYAFRGADKRYMERFFEDYPGAGRFYLARSFRCVAPLVDAANRLMGAEIRGNEAAVTLSRAAYPTEKSEAEGIARRIAGLAGGTSFFALDSGTLDPARVEGPPARANAGNAERAGVPGEMPEGSHLGDIAILLRTFSLAPPLLKALNDHGIPYDYGGEKPWWEREPVCSLIAALTERAGSGNAAGISPREAALSAWEEVKRRKKTPDRAGEDARLVDRLVDLAGWYDSLEEMLDTLAVTGGGDDPAAASANARITTQGVRIMSVHASKGLEFSHVFVPALEEGIFPLTRFREDDPALRLEEERRLLYVAMTRAKRGLYLSWARSRVLQGAKRDMRASSFLSHLEDLIPLEKETRRLPPREAQLRLF